MASYRFFCNRECEFFPCHDVADSGDFNCLFCYCPLYALGSECGGDFSYTAEGIKDCSGCLIPHGKDAYEYISGRIEETMVRRRADEDGKGEVKD